MEGPERLRAGSLDGGAALSLDRDGKNKRKSDLLAGFRSSIEMDPSQSETGSSAKRSRLASVGEFFDSSLMLPAPVFGEDVEDEIFKDASLEEPNRDSLGASGQQSRLSNTDMIVARHIASQLEDSSELSFFQVILMTSFSFLHYIISCVCSIIFVFHRVVYFFLQGFPVILVCSFASFSDLSVLPCIGFGRTVWLIPRRQGLLFPSRLVTSVHFTCRRARFQPVR